MRASETTLRGLLEGTKQFQIPLFQRSYAWDKKNWDTLWTDLMSLYNGEVEDPYFLGPIVTQAIPGTADGVTPFVVIDGQQRLITFTVLLATLRHHLLNRKDNNLADELYEQYLINKFKQNHDYYKVYPTQHDRQAYQNIIQSQTKQEIKIEGESKKIHDLYKFFDAKLEKIADGKHLSIEYKKLKQIILEKLILVNITSEERDNPYLIFESLNYKGQDLTQADLVRNYIFMKLNSQEREQIYKDKWLPLEDKFKENKGTKYVEELTNAFWFYTRKDGDSPTKKEIYKAIKKKIDASKNDIKIELNDLIKFVNYYQRLNFKDQEQQDELKYRFQRLITLNFNTCHIFLLNIYRDYEESGLKLEDFKKILVYLESYFIRRFLVGISPKSLGGVFNILYKEVKEKKANNIVNGLHKVLKNKKGTQIWPDDNELRRGIFNTNVYTKNSLDRVKLILESIERYHNKKEPVESNNLQIEHIMPQKLNQNWEKMLGSNYNDVHKQWVHTLGNLTLTGYNSELSNKPFEAKKLIYQESSISLNKYFGDIENWNEEEIKQRSEKLADIAIKVWPR